MNAILTSPRKKIKSDADDIFPKDGSRKFNYFYITEHFESVFKNFIRVSACTYVCPDVLQNLDLFLSPVSLQSPTAPSSGVFTHFIQFVVSIP